MCEHPSIALDLTLELTGRRRGKGSPRKETPATGIDIRRRGAGTEQLPDNTRQPADSAWPQRVREVPDMLFAAQLSLGALAKGESAPTSDEARRIVRHACDLLNVAYESA
jgi:hypothetical protein